MAGYLAKDVRPVRLDFLQLNIESIFLALVGKKQRAFLFVGKNAWYPNEVLSQRDHVAVL